jgi:hypothetical protein
MNQHEWVYGCYAYYLENGYEPGNPEDGEWHNCHWPVPACLGGSKTILLLKEHHAVQGVLQSEEWQHPCISTWEAKYLEGDLLALCKKWQSELSRKGNAALTTEQRRKGGKKASLARVAATTPAQRSEFGRKGHEARMANTTPKHRSEFARRAHAALTPEQRSERSRRGNASRTPEQRSEAIRKGHETRRLNLLRQVSQD